jgi:hypothetical protein
MSIKKLLQVVMISIMTFASATHGSLTKAAFRTTPTINHNGAIRPVAPWKIVDKEYDEYRRQVLERFLKKDFSWIDQEAGRLRAGKDRLAGGYWKLRALYAALENPSGVDEVSDGDWDDLIHELADWSGQRPKSVTAKVALAAAWEGYAWKARGGGSADSVSEASWETFHKRLDVAEQILSKASSLRQRCPHWFVIALWIGIGQNWDRNALEKVFQAGIKLEPTYYYVYQAKASYLLPRWGGAEGEWEEFADQSALKIGGHQGDIIFFAIYSQMLSMHDITFMNTHQKAVPKLIAGFRSIEKLYGASPHRLNEACFFASYGNDDKSTGEFFNRIGDDYDESVWHSKRTFEIMRQGFQQREKSSQRQNSSLVWNADGTVLA